MKLQFKIFVLLAFSLLFTACTNSSAEEATDGKLEIVATNSILADMVENVAGDNANVYSIVPIGTDPHAYEQLPEDLSKLTDADIIFYNGLNLETGGGNWFKNLVDTTSKIEDEDYFLASKGVEPMYLNSTGLETEQDPHAWLDIQNGIIYVENIRDVLIEKDPENANSYITNSDEYTARLQSLDAEAKTKFSDIPESMKLLVSNEGAFKYFSKAYGLTAAYIWEINTENQGTSEQMSDIIDIIRQWEVSSLFVESSVDPRSMEQVSTETKTPIYSTIFTDSLAKKGEPGDNYYDMIKWNLEKIYEGLSKN